MYHGIINVYKEPGFTSFDVIAVLRKILQQKKIGHTGTLDPAAEGVLLVCLGNGTKLCDMLENKTKEYICTMRLGISTDTEDMTGQIIEERPVNCTEDEIRNAIGSFVGEYMQIPPMYSALKVDGKKLYELAREGKVIERQSRKVVLYNISILEISENKVIFKVLCSKGTYVRSLCRDIGERLGCGAAMEHLVRTEVSGFRVESSLKLSEIKELKDEGRFDEYVLSLRSAFSDITFLDVKEEFAKKIDNGNPMEQACFVQQFVAADNALYGINDTKGRFAGVYRYLADKMIFMPEKMFPDNND